MIRSSCELTFHRTPFFIYTLEEMFLCLSLLPYIFSGTFSSHSSCLLEISLNHLHHLPIATIAFFSASPIFKIFQRYFVVFELKSKLHHSIYKVCFGPAHLFPTPFLALLPGVFNLTLLQSQFSLKAPYFLSVRALTHTALSFCLEHCLLITSQLPKHSRTFLDCPPPTPTLGLD